VIDILVAAFFLKKTREKRKDDSIILSKGHAAAGLYAVLNAFGEINDSDIVDYGTDGSKFYGHVNHNASSLIPLSTGSLGHGLPFGLGIAISMKKRKSDSKSIVVISDGECDEGTTWESALLASHNELNNLILIIDNNGIQSLGTTKDTLNLEPLMDKWVSFGWNVQSINGHDLDALIEAIEKPSDKPLCIVANTVKGKGVDFMENSVDWHYKSPNDTELANGISQVKG
jgi:transketolase